MAGYVADVGKVEWLTPQPVVDALEQLWGGPPDLDPCSHPDALVLARRRVMPPKDGLTTRWTGTVFVNPPFGELEAWAAKCVQASEADGAEVVLLLPSRTDTGYWQTHVATAEAICFWRGRLRFVGAPASAPFPVALAYWGPRPWDFQAVFKARGHVVRP